uniref:Similar to a Valine/tyrosine/tryptophan amino-acid permease n=1 Tax=Podospora anserina TaxID=2587412 RepID=Q86ZL7_PODAS|nr:unnamed protein product [Podospora anserina]
MVCALFLNRIGVEDLLIAGIGLFLGSGRSLASAGPGGAVLCYILMGTVQNYHLFCVICPDLLTVTSHRVKMTALMSVNAPVMEFPRRFMSRGVGFAVGWVYWFAYAVLAGEQLVAVSNAINSRWVRGLIMPCGYPCFRPMLMLPFKVFGELEYIFGCFKLMFIILLIMVGHSIEGSLGTLLGVWTTFTSVMSSYIGMDIVAATAAESRALSDVESMKMAARKINLRVITLYSLAMLPASFVVPMDHPFINGHSTSVGARSIFIIAVVEAGMPKVAHFFNAVFVFSAFTCGINSMYIATRVLHTLALRGQTGPEFITRRLRQCRSGVPS